MSATFGDKAATCVAGVIGLACAMHSPQGFLLGIIVGSVFATCGWSWFKSFAIGEYEKKKALDAAKEAKDAMAKAGVSAKAQVPTMVTPPVRAAMPTQPVVQPAQAPLPTAVQPTPVMAPVEPVKRVRKVSKPRATATVGVDPLETSAPVRGNGLAMPPD